MNVVNPNNTTHEILIIPRFYPTGSIVVNLFNEATQTNEVVTNTYTVVDGKMTVEFDYTFIESGRFQVKITESTNVVYRGKLFATAQQAQNYSTTVNAYY